MGSFNKYSRYYDLLYREKDYQGEAAYIDGLIKTYHPGAETVLDMGCGTGRHAGFLAKRGYKIHGIDSSETMLEAANEIGDGKDLTFSLGDIRDARLGNNFDAVISLFHVISYQINNDDLLDTFTTAFAHLKKGGIFIFDCWYGPAVLTHRPAVRVKKIKDKDLEITRLAQPVMHANENSVNVNYHIFVRYKNTGQVDEIKENHRMRYLFKPEVDSLLRQTGFTLEGFFEYMTGNEPGYNTWSVCFVGRKK